MINNDKFDYIFEYHRYRINGVRNDDFDGISGKILDLKEDECSKHTAAVLELGANLRHKLSIRLNPQLKYFLVIVPSHKKGKISQGLIEICKICANELPNVVFDDNPLVRNETIDKLARGGNRSVETHKSSVGITDSFQSNVNYVLIDDVVTTGNSLQACNDIIEENQSRVTNVIAIGKTVLED